MVESLVNNVLVWVYVLVPIVVFAGAMGAASFLAQVINRSNAPAAKSAPKGGKPAAGGGGGGGGGHH